MCQALLHTNAACAYLNKELAIAQGKGLKSGVDHKQSDAIALMVICWQDCLFMTPLGAHPGSVVVLPTAMLPACHVSATVPVAVTVCQLVTLEVAMAGKAY
jgi:hypothetical protein